jgi:hypothetical protein
MKKILIIASLLLTALVPMNVKTEIVTNKAPFVQATPVTALAPAPALALTPAPVKKENKKIEIVKDIPKKHKQEIAQTEKKIIPQTQTVIEIAPAIVIEKKELVIAVVDRIEGDMAVIESKDRTTKDVLLSDLPSGIERSMALVLDNGIYTISLEETQKRKAVIEEKLKDMFI